MVLLDNGCQFNPIIPGFVETHSLNVAQVDRAEGYNEEQIALVIPDSSKFTSQVLAILGALMTRPVTNVMKESELDAVATLWITA